MPRGSGGESMHGVLPTGGALFPLPFSYPSGRKGFSGRRQAQRHNRRYRAEFELCETLQALNWMHGFDFTDHSTRPHSSQIQNDVIARVSGLIDRAGALGELHHPFSPEAALKSLLQGRSDYHEPTSPIALAPFDLELISLPATLKEAPRAEDLLPESDRLYLKEQERMFRPNHMSDEFFKPYWDPALKHSPRKYRSFIKKLDSIHYLRYTLHPVEMAGIFFVKKSDGRRIRMIVDGRGANLRLRDPPSVSLSTAETFSRIEMTVPEDLLHDKDGRERFFESLEVCVALSDVKDCFHRIRQPEWMCRLFCLLPIEARHVGLTGQLLDGVVLQSNDLVYPMPGSLAMGCSWSLYFAQKINEYQFKLSPGLSCSDLKHDRGAPLVIDPSDPHALSHYVYVDNLGIIGQNKKLVSEGLESMENHFNSKQLLLHPGEVHTGSVKALGIQLDGSSKTTRISPERLHKVRSGLRGLISRGRCSGRVLEIVIGHATFCGLACRLVLSVFHTTYKFIEKNYEKSCPLWDSVKDELRAFAGLMVFLESDWKRGWNTLVTSSDASEKGFGVCTSHWTSQQVAAAGRVPEKSRFRRTESHRARESALSAAGFYQETSTGKWLAGEIDSEEYLSNVGWECSSDFREIDAQLLHRHLWTPKSWGTWKHEEHIVILEARALNKALDRVAYTRYGHDIRQLFLVDSMSIALSFDRCRSRSFKLLRQIRRFASLCLARNLDPHVRWIPSEFNSADEPSRADAAEPSKTLVDHIPKRPHVQREENQGPIPTNSFESAFGKKDEGSWARVGDRQDCKFVSDFNPSQDIAAGKNEDKPAVVPNLGPHKCPVGRKDDQEGQDSGHLFRQLKFVERSCSEEEGEESCGKEPSSVEEVRGRIHGSKKPRVVAFGEESNRERCGQVLQHGVWLVPDLCHQQQPDFEQSRSSRCGYDKVHESPLPSGSSFTPGRQADGGLYAPSPGVQPIWIQPSSSLIQSFEGLEKIGTRFFKEGIPARSVGGNRHGVGEAGTGENGSFHYDMSLSLHSAKRALSLQDYVVGASHTPDHRILVSTAESGRTLDSLQDGGVRRQHPVRLSLFEALGFSAVPRAEKAVRSSAVVGLQLSKLLPGFHGCGQKTSDRCDSLQHETFGAVHRQEPKPEAAPRSSKKGKMEKPQKCGQIREVSSPCCQLQSVAYKDATSLPPRRSTFRGCDAGSYQTPSASVKRGNRPNMYVADLFAGKGGVAHQCRRLGYKAKEWEIDRGLQYDLTSKAVRKVIIKDIKRCRLLAAMMAPPCTTFSIARDRTKVIRSRAYPWGLPADQLTPAELEKVEEGNRCFEAAFELIHHLNRHRIPWILENPATSKCWFLKPIQDLLLDPACTLITLDFCQFGTPWRKATSLLCGNLDSQDLQRLQRRCRGTAGVCSRTQKRHWQLSGTHKGVNMTKLAQPYPTDLCRQIAFVLTAPSHYNPP